MVWTEPQILFLSYSSAIHANKTMGVWAAVQSAHMVGKYMGIRLCYCSNWILLVHSKIIHNNRKKRLLFQMAGRRRVQIGHRFAVCGRLREQDR